MTDALYPPGDLVAHAAFLRRLARTLLVDTHAADDAVQDALGRALERPPARGGDPRGWLARVLQNFVRRRWRSESRRDARERASARTEALPPAEASLERAEAVQRVADAVHALAEPYRATILARFYEELLPRSIAARDGVSVETVNTRLKRGLALLRARLASDERDWLGALGLIAGESPCLPAGVTVSATTVLGVAVAAALILTLGWTALRGIGGDEPGTGAAHGSPSSTAALAALAPSERAAREPVAGAARAPRALSGRVADEQGVPLVGVKVLVVGHEDPFAADDASPQVWWDPFRGRSVTTDDDGRWSVVLADERRSTRRDCTQCHDTAPAAIPEPERVLVTLEHSPVYELSTEELARWVDTPAADVDFAVRCAPSGTVEVRVFEGASRQPIEDFRVSVHGGVETLPGGGSSYPHGYHLERSKGAVLRVPWRIDDPAGSTLHVTLIEPDVGNVWSTLVGEPERLQQDVVLLPGETESVVFVLPERGVVRGQVVDGFGAPVTDALVYFGTELAARGDEPFKPLKFERVIGGVRSGADGWFELRGAGALVTALHPDFSGETVEVARAGRLVLGARGALLGRVTDAGGGPAAGIELRLDRQRDGVATTTDANGSFTFEGVERGAHAVWGPGAWPLACVRLGTGEERELELSLAEPATLELALDPADALATSKHGALAIGRGALFDVRWWSGAEVVSGTLSVDAPRPDAYWFVSDRGVAAPFELGPGDAKVVLARGTAELVVGGKVSSVQVVPADADPFLRLMAARLRVRLDPEQGARFWLAPGRYELVGEGGEVLRAFELPLGGLELTLE